MADAILKHSISSELSQYDRDPNVMKSIIGFRSTERISIRIS